MYILTKENLIFHILIAIPLFYFIKWVFKKNNKQKKYLYSALLTILITPLLYSLGIFIFFSILFYQPSKDFDKATWDSKPNKRYEMANDIVESRILINRDSNNVKMLLGSSYCNVENLQDTVMWTYNLGSGVKNLGFAFHLLYISFVNNKVIKVEHTEFGD